MSLPAASNFEQQGVTGHSDEDSDDDREAEDIEAPLFSCHDKSAHIYTHAKIEHLIFHLGRDIFQRGSSVGGVHQSLTVHAALRWNTVLFRSIRV
jgi:hypothetical protein